jgi:hypothetical protein
MKRSILVISIALLLAAAYIAGTRVTTARAQAPAPQVSAYQEPAQGSIPKSYGRLAATIADSIGTGLVFEGADGTIRFVSVTGMKEGELSRYDTTPTRGGIPRSYGHLAGAVVNNGNTGLIFEDSNGVIRFVTLTGKVESELKRE